MIDYHNKGLEGIISKHKIDWCHAGGSRNFAKINIRHNHENYGMPCIIGWIAELKVYTNRCIYCGAIRRIADGYDSYQRS
jgi:hypothetical protein